MRVTCITVGTPVGASTGDTHWGSSRSVPPEVFQYVSIWFWSRWSWVWIPDCGRDLSSLRLSKTVIKNLNLWEQGTSVALRFNALNTMAELQKIAMHVALRGACACHQKFIRSTSSHLLNFTYRWWYECSKGFWLQVIFKDSFKLDSKASHSFQGIYILYGATP